MFRALDRLNHEAVTILDSCWDREAVEGDLRRRGHDDQLLCPHCQSPVLVKAGEILRWHFAHQRVQDCPLQHESPQRLTARSVLYRWLVGKFAPDTRHPGQVTVEAPCLELDLPRPFDALVQTEQGRRFAYWLIDGGIRPVHVREQMLAVRSASEAITIHFVFLAHLVQRVDGHDNRFRLRKIERLFTHMSDYARPYGSRASLHYLDPETQRLITLRGLHGLEGPTVHIAEGLIKHDLTEVLVCPRTGEFVHPGEHERAQRWEQEQTEREQERQQQAVQERARQQQAHRAWLASQTNAPSPLPRSTPTRSPQTSRDARHRPARWAPTVAPTRVLRCAKCQQQVQAKHASKVYPSQGLCLCKRCVGAG